MHDIAEFLGRHPPFAGLSEDELAKLSESVEIEYFAADDVIFRQGEEPVGHVRVVRRGAIELLDRGHVLDLLGEGELVGHPSMLSGLPTGFEARAAEESLAYRLPAEAVVPLLGSPGGLQYLARSLLERPRPEPAALRWGLDPARQPAGSLVTDPPVFVAAGSTLRETAQRMAEARADCALVRTEKGELGIVTGHDLRDVIASGRDVNTPVDDVMSSPVVTVGAERFGSEAMLEMLTRGIRHVPVVSSSGEVMGVIRAMDLLAAEAGAPFALRRAIDESTDRAEVVAASKRIDPMVISLYEAEVPPAQVGSILAAVIDGLTERLLELELADRGAPPAPVQWLSLGSLGRREVVPSSDIDSALVWDGEVGDADGQRWVSDLAQAVVDGLAECGFPPDSNGATGSDSSFARPLQGWRDGIRQALAEPDENAALILLSLLMDGRVVYRVGDSASVLDELHDLDHRPALRSLMLRLALAHKPPTGFLRGLVVEHSGKHAGELDLKHGGFIPISGLARYGSLAADAKGLSTRERLRIAADAGMLDPAEARELTEAYELFWRLRLDHQVDQLERGERPDDFIDPDALSPLVRSHLRDAFHVVSKVQRRYTNKLLYG